MRHIYIRGILGFIWLAAAVVSVLSGSFEMAAFYVILGSMFLYLAFSAWKKEKDGRGGR